MLKVYKTDPNVCALCKWVYNTETDIEKFIVFNNVYFCGPCYRNYMSKSLAELKAKAEDHRDKKLELENKFINREACGYLTNNDNPNYDKIMNSYIQVVNLCYARAVRAASLRKILTKEESCDE